MFERVLKALIFTALLVVLVTRNLVSDGWKHGESLLMVSAALYY